MRKSAGMVMALVAVLLVLRIPSAQGRTVSFTTSTTTAITSTTECLLPPCAVGCGPFPGPNGGCPTCSCPNDNCDNLNCGPDQYCFMDYSGCPMGEGSCFPQPTCKSYDTTTSSTTSVTPTSDTTSVTPTSPCPIYTCGPWCGLVSGPDGCPVCGCSSYTCEFVDCGPDMECVNEYVKCPGVETPCYHPQCNVTTTLSSTPSTTWCPMVTCSGGCQSSTDSNGCGTCVCPPSCEDIWCPDGEHCELLPTPCYSPEAQCFPQPVCVPTTDTTTFSTTTSSCPPPYPLCYEECSPGTGPDGCPSCDCPVYSCQNVTCGPGQECILQDFNCGSIRTPCLPRPACVPPYDTTTNTTADDTTTPATTSPCPVPLCLEDCLPVAGPDGCPICECPVYTCQNVTCEPDEDCIMEDVQCFAAPCFAQPKCVPFNETRTTSTTTPITTSPCLLPPCALLIGCRSVPGPDGCPTCACPDYTCQDVICGPGEECIMQDNGCRPNTTQCFPQPTCIPLYETTSPCPMIKCAPTCSSSTGLDGCPACACPRTCQDVNCTNDQECVMQEVYCFTDPCFPEPTCVSRDASCMLAPNTQRCGRFWLWFWFYNSSTNACEKFRNYGCTASPNTFLSRKECEDKCTRKEPLVCTAMACANDCFTLTKKDQCPQCICPNPCKDVKCSGDDECMLREETCVEKQCRPEPFCAPRAPKSCPDQPPCGLRCMNGLETDEKGCQLCKCIGFSTAETTAGTADRSTTPWPAV